MGASDHLLPNDATCIDCRYSLQAVTQDVCPECGRSFLANDPTTYWIRGGAPPWRYWAKPPSLWSILPLIALAVWEFYATSLPGFMEQLWPAIIAFVTIFVVGLSGLVYILRAVGFSQDRPRAAMDRSKLGRRRRWRWAVLPLFVVMMISIALFQWPLLLRFEMSRPAFDEMQQQLEAGASPPASDVWLGFYRVSIENVDGEPVYLPRGTRFGTRFGFVRGSPTSKDLHATRSLGGGWKVVSYIRY